MDDTPFGKSLGVDESLGMGEVHTIQVGSFLITTAVVARAGSHTKVGRYAYRVRVGVLKFERSRIEWVNQMDQDFIYKRNSIKEPNA